MMKKLLNGAGALLVLAGLLVGMPLLLVAMAGNPFPTAEQWDAIISLTPDYGNVIMITKVIPLVIWVLWASFAVPFLIELVAAVRGRRTQKKVVAFKFQQKVAGSLIGAVAIMFAGGAGALAAPAPAAASIVAVGTTDGASATTTAPSAVSAPQVQLSAPAQEAAEVQQAVVHPVVEGDTLWDMADQYLGDGTRYPEIFEANRGVQPDGSVLSDPDLIYPGQQLLIPGAAAPVSAVEQPAQAPQIPSEGSSTTTAPVDGDTTSATGESAVEGRGGGAAQERAVADERPTASNTPSDLADAEEVDTAFPLMTAGGMAGILLVGILGALGARRLRQRRRRPKGQRIALPEPQVADFELEMRMVENPAGVADIDNSLRTLQAWAEDTGAQLPELLAVRVANDEVALYLAEPAALPEPFEMMHPDQTAWVVRAGKAQAPERPTVAPYPALATIGVDARGGSLLLDLEQIGSLNIVGDTQAARGMLNALAGEFARNPWSDQIQVTLVGMNDALAGDLDAFRIHHVADVPALIRNLKSDLDDRRAALDSYGVGGVLEGRSRATELEAWAPHIVILADTQIGSLRDELAELVARMPRLGIATIAQGDTLVAGATIEVTSKDSAQYLSGGTLPPLPFRPQILAGEELELLRSLFATTELDARPADVLQERPQRDLDPAAELPPVDAAQDAIATAPQTVEDVEVAFPAADAVQAHVEVAESSAEEITVTVPDWPAPYIRLLGPVDALNVDQEALPGRGIEFLAFLLLQDTRYVPGDLVQAKLWQYKYSHDNNDARQLATKVRAVLGHDPDGRALLPEGSKNAGFTLHEQIRTDWHDFCDLIGPDLSTTTNENLIRAIRLVRGQPFDGVKRARGTRPWWAWRETIEQTMLAAIMDAADELTHRALSTGKLNEARLSAKIAKSTDPLNEAGWRLEIETAMTAGDAEAFNSIVDAMFDVIGDVDLDDATQQLLDTAHATLPGLSGQ